MATCIPLGSGAPWASGPPSWWTPAPSPPPVPDLDRSTDDPHWGGSYERTRGNDGAGAGARTQTSFRAMNGSISGTSYLFLSWLVFLDPTVTAGPDQLWVGLGAGSTGTSAAMLIQLQLASVSAHAGDDTKYTVANVWSKAAGGSAWNSIATPTWLTDKTRVWIDDTPPTTGVLLPWAFEMAVPLGTALDPPTGAVLLPNGTDFKMWYSMVIGFDPPAVGPAEVNWPNTVSFSNVRTSTDISAWESYRASPTASAPGCATGISIAPANIGTADDNNTPTGSARADQYEIKLDFTNTPPDANAPNHNNLFFARPQFPAGTPDNEKQAVTARFRLAQWGSNLGTLTGESWTDLAGGDAVSYDTTAAQCHFIWPTNEELNPAQTPDPTTRDLVNSFRSGAREPHQCLLVELSSSFPNESFVTDSVYWNFHIVAGSTFSRVATIDLAGLAPISIQPRDVLLFVQTTNMPATIDDGSPIDSPNLNRDQFLAMSREKQDLTADDLAGFMPTYTVHAFVDSGLRTTDFGPDPRPIWTPMTTFGYAVTHEGQLTGWSPRLEGAIRLSKNLYLLRVPNDGSATVNTVVQALEPGDPTPPDDPIQAWPGPTQVMFPPEWGPIYYALDKIEDAIESKVPGWEHLEGLVKRFMH